jgi:hypothetical protein
MSRWDGSGRRSRRWFAGTSTSSHSGGAWHEDAAATVAGGAAIRSNECRGQGWRDASYAPWTRDNAAEAEENLEEKEAGIIGVWAKYDKSKIADDLEEELKYSRRPVKLKKAFQKYRRTILRMLWRACLLRRLFGIWRSVAASVAPGVLDLILSEDDLSNFLEKVASFDAQVAYRQRVKAARADRRHQDHGKAMPRLIPASLIKLWQVCLAHEHGDLFDKHFGKFSRHLVDTSSTRIREYCWNQELQKTAEALSADVSKRQRVMTKLEEQAGSKLWAYFFERSQALVADETKKEDVGDAEKEDVDEGEKEDGDEPEKEDVDKEDLDEAEEEYENSDSLCSMSLELVSV